MMPGNAIKRHVEVEKRLNQLAEDANTLPLNRAEYRDLSVGFITSGIAYQYVREAMPEASVLKLGLVHPLPRKLIEEFASRVDKLYIFEELEPVIEEQVKSWGIGKAVGKELFTRQGEYSANMIRERVLGEKPQVDPAAQVPARPPIPVSYTHLDPGYYGNLPGKAHTDRGVSEKSSGTGLDLSSRV